MLIHYLCFLSKCLAHIISTNLIIKTKDENKYFGRDEFFNSVIVESDENLTGKIKNVKITKLNQNTLFSENSSKIIKKDFAA